MKIIVEQSRSGRWYASCGDLVAVGRTRAEAIEALRGLLRCDLTAREADQLIQSFIARGQTPRHQGPPDAA
jgi:hypothetical protein